MKRSLVSALALVGLYGVAAAEEGRPLKLEAVDQVIEQSDRAVQACSRGARRDMLAVLLRLDIDAEGRVTGVESSAKVTPESTCLVRVAKRMKFPSTGTVSHVEYPFMLMPQLRR